MTKRLPPRWEIVTLGDLCRTQPGTSEFNKGHYVSEGYPAFSAAGQDGLLPLYQHTGEAVILSSIGAQCGKCFFAEGQWTAIANTQVIWPDLNRLVPRFLFFYLNHFFEWYKAGSAQPFVKLTDSKQKPIPLPPLAVQERIVAILEKADEIRRKRQETLRIADEVLPALFIEMFGDPATNPKGYRLRTLAECVHIRRGLSKRPTPSGTVPIVRIKNLTLQGLDLSWHESVNLTPRELERGQLKEGDIVFSPLNGSLDHLAKSHAFHEPPGVTWVLDSNLCAFRAREGVVLSPFLASWLCLPATLDDLRHRLAVRTSGGQWLLKSSTLAAIELPVPPLSEQQRFAEYASAYESVRAKLQASLRDAEATFSVLLQQAFTGELTAEWEARNADWIAERQAFYERLPQLVLLAFLHEKAQQARKAGVLITALMKYAFLLQMEGASRRRLYSFVPYHYGPFAQEVYSDLENLQQQGLVTIEENDEKTRISLAAPHKAEQALQELPEDLRQDVAAIVEAYGNLDHERLLKVVYERYPAYAKKSRRRSTHKRSE